eukprot:11664407-Alexandrium_andersonii.AAC.1
MRRSLGRWARSTQTQRFERQLGTHTSARKTTQLQYAVNPQPQHAPAPVCPSTRVSGHARARHAEPSTQSARKALACAFAC